MTDDAGTIFNNLIDEYKTIKERDEQEQEGFPKPYAAGQFYLRVDTGELFVAALAGDGGLKWSPVGQPSGTTGHWV